MNNYFKETNWDSIFENEQDVDILWDKLELETLSAKDKFIPKKVIKKRTLNYKTKAPIPKTLLDHIHSKRKAFK